MTEGVSPMSITCPSCGDLFPVPAEVVKVDVLNNEVLVRLDRTGAYGHFTNCATRHRTPHVPGREMVKVEGVSARQLVIPTAVLAGRIHEMLRVGAFMSTKGSRACTLCGMNGTACIDQLTSNETPCCAGCGNGNTHPAPSEGDRCAEWAESNGCKS